MNDTKKNLLPEFLLGLIVLGLGAMEDWYGRFDYAGDAIAYLDISKAITHGDWSLALSPYWSIGYPMILAAIRWIFPVGPQGEWTSIHVLNLIIFLATYMSFIYLLKNAMAYLARATGVEAAGPGTKVIFAIGTTVFLLLQLLINNVSRVSPDLLVSGVFFLITAEFLNFALRPRTRAAVLIGLLMGLGYILKAVFLPLSIALFLVMFLYVGTRPAMDRRLMISKLAWALPPMAIMVSAYVAANSITAGFFTLGETGGLNYAWSVNHLPAWTHWQGGPVPLGSPIHPTQMLSKDPHVFAFAEPFHVTYPPWFNPFYWYEGYHHYFNIWSQLSALKSNLSFLWHFFLRGPRGLAAAALLLVGVFFLKERRIWWKRLVVLWPFYLPSILAVGIYVFVVVEPRYLIGFLIILLTTPLLALFSPTPLVSYKAGYSILFILALGSATMLAENQKEALYRFTHHESYTSDEQWRIGIYLAQSGVHPGAKVASVGVHGGMRCTWAYVSGVHVAAEIGDNSFAPQDQQNDFNLFTQSLAVQRPVFDLFRQAGAVMVIALDVDGPPQGPGWECVPGTKSWIHRL